MLYFCNLIFFLKKEYKIKLDNVAQNIDVKKPYNPKIIIWKKSIIDPGIGKEYKISDERIEWLVNDKAKTNNILKKNDLILTGAYGFPVPINEKKLIEVTSSAFGDVSSTFI